MRIRPRRTSRKNSSSPEDAAKIILRGSARLSGVLVGPDAKFLDLLVRLFPSATSGSRPGRPAKSCRFPSSRLRLALKGEPSR